MRTYAKVNDNRGVYREVGGARVVARTMNEKQEGRKNNPNVRIERECVETPGV